MSFAITLLLASCSERHDSSQTSARPSRGVSVLDATSIRLPQRLSVFGEDVPLDIPEVRERCERELLLNLQTPGQLVLNIKRSGRFFAMFERLARNSGVPDDVKYLAVAESALIMSRSGKDAVGLWQFLDGTARSYGLRVDAYVDERKHVEKSTRAAMAYLKDAYKMFGSWTLAAASYNMGIEGVRSSLASQGARNYFDTYFNDETSRYIPRIAVLKELMEHASRYGIPSDFPRYDDGELRVLKVTTPISDLAAWARQQKCSYKDVRMLNPWILGSSLPSPRGAWEITIPA